MVLSASGLRTTTRGVDVVSLKNVPKLFKDVAQEPIPRRLDRSGLGLRAMLRTLISELLHQKVNELEEEAGRSKTKIKTGTVKVVSKGLKDGGGSRSASEK